MLAGDIYVVSIRFATETNVSFAVFGQCDELRAVIVCGFAEIDGVNNLCFIFELASKIVELTNDKYAFSEPDKARLLADFASLDFCASVEIVSATIATAHI